MATADQRAHMFAVMNFLLAHRAQVHYTQLRPMATVVDGMLEQDAANLFAKGGTIAPDCSEMVTLICRWCGLHDPSGLGYSGFGDTETIYDRLPKPPGPVPHVGALVTFGAPTLPLAEQHIAMVYAPSVNLDSTILFSHGSSAGPITLTLGAYKAAEPAQVPVTFLSTAGL